MHLTARLFFIFSRRQDFPLLGASFKFLEYKINCRSFPKTEFAVFTASIIHCLSALGIKVNFDAGLSPWIPKSFIDMKFAANYYISN